jgi:hypothetical protein
MLVSGKQDNLQKRINKKFRLIFLNVQILQNSRGEVSKKAVPWTLRPSWCYCSVSYRFLGVKDDRTKN